MAGKHKSQLYIDQQPAVNFGAVAADPIEDLAPPAIPSLDTVEDLALDSFLQRSAATPFALISATWSQPDGTEPQRYAVQWSIDSDFPMDNTGGFDAPYPSCSIEGLKTATLYYVRVAAIYRSIQGPWCDAVSITTESDTTAPDEPDNVSWSWTDTGDLLLFWTEPTDDNFRDVEIRIWNSSGKTTLYTVDYSASGTYTWTLAEQRRAQSSPSVLDAAVYFELKSRSWSGVLSDAVTPVSQPSKAAPSAPAGLTTTWAGDPGAAGVAGADCVISWTADANIRRWVLTIDGTARDVAGNRYTYTLDANKSEHSNSPDPVLTLGLVGYDALGQVSPSSAATATNGVPAAVTATTLAGFSALAITITASTAVDWQRYSVRIVKDGSTVETIQATSTSILYRAMSKGNYQVGVTVVDLLNQSSVEGTLSSSAYLDAMTIEELRAEAIYSDSVGTSSSSLDILKNGLTGAGITYAASASAYRWTQIERANRKMVRRITLQLGSGSASFYVATSVDGITWRWFSSVSGVDNFSLTEQANEAAAQAATSLFSALTYGFAELPSEVDCRYVVVYHRHTSASYRLDECYPRSRLTVDDLDAQIIRGMTISGDQLIVNQLSALVADLGTITAGTVTGATVQTATSGARVVLSSAAAGGLIGYGASDTYSVTAGTGTYQVLWKKADGKLYAGGGAVVLDSDGVGITGDSFTFSLYNLTPVTPVRANAVEWTVGSGTKPSIVGSSSSGQLLARGQRITLAIPIDSTYAYGLNLQSNGAHALTAASFSVAADLNTSATAFEVTAGLFASGCSIKTEGGANIGTATGAGTGQVRASGYLTTGGAGSLPASAVVGIGYDSASTRGLLVAINNGTYLRLDLEGIAVNIRYQTTTRIQVNSTGIGFFNVTPVAQQTGGALTAAGTYGANEQTMLNRLWTAARNLGLIT